MPALSEMKSWYDRLLYGWTQNEESICVMCSCKVMLYSPDAHRKTFGTLRYFGMIYPLLIRTHSSFCDQSYCFLSIVRHCGALQSVIWGWKKSFGFAKAYNGLWNRMVLFASSPLRRSSATCRSHYNLAARKVVLDHRSMCLACGTRRTSRGVKAAQSKM